jgi:hypothetical protein
MMGLPPVVGQPQAPKTRPSLEVIPEAWKLFSANPGVWLLNGATGTILCLAALLPTYLHPPVLPFDPNNIQDPSVMMDSASSPSFLTSNQDPIMWMLISIVLLTWVGYVHMAASYPLVAKQLSGEEVSAADAISFNGHGFKVLIVSFLMGLEVTLAYFFCYFPGPSVEGLTMVTVHRTVDRGEGIHDSYKNGARAVSGQLFRAIVVVHVLGAILCLSMLLLGMPPMTPGKIQIGIPGILAMIVVIPIYNISRALLYRRTVQAEQMRMAR